MYADEFARTGYQGGLQWYRCLVGKYVTELETVDPKIKGRFAELGTTETVGNSAEFGTFIADETEQWARVTRAANIKLE